MEATRTDPKGLFRSRDPDEDTPVTAIIVGVAVDGTPNSPRSASLREMLAVVSSAYTGAVIAGADELLILDRSTKVGGVNSRSRPEVVAYWLARHTSTDCYEKRGQKGLAIIVVDRKPQRSVTPEDVDRLIGDHVHEIDMADLFAELAERWDVRILIAPWAPAGTEKGWRALSSSGHASVASGDASLAETIANLIGSPA